MSLFRLSIAIIMLSGSVRALASTMEPLTDTLRGQSFVDILISDYLVVEQALWMSIENRADNVLLHVYKTHENFFVQTIGKTASGVLVKNLVPNHEKIADIEFNLNATAELGYTHLREQELDRNSITEYANYSLKFLNDANMLFELTAKNEFWEEIISHLKKCHKNGETVQASHQVIFDYYKDIQSGLLKSYITSQMSYMILAYYNGSEKYRAESLVLRNTFETQIARIRGLTKYHLRMADKAVWKCDAINNKVYSSYAEITNFLQGFVDNEANLNGDASCSATCSTYWKSRHFQCQSGSLCDRSVNDHDAAKCNGIIRHCQEIDNSDVNICEVGETNRHYNSIKYSDGRLAGYANAECHGRLRVESWIRWFVKCSNCICLCDDVNNKKSDRYFSLREVVSNIADNKIVTGVTLTKQNGVIHLAISERNLLPFGQTEISGPYQFVETWKGTPDFFGINDIGVRENVDYYALTYEHRSINLDHVTAPLGHLVTGVRFRIVNERISLEIRATEFNFVSGKLENVGNSLWITNPNCGENQIVLHKPGNPIKSSTPSIVDDTKDAYIEFGPTDYWTDVSQLTVPFFDTQRVEPYLPIPLSGVGLYHKAAPGYGGFIAPKLIVYDFEMYIPDS